MVLTAKSMKVEHTKVEPTADVVGLFNIVSSLLTDCAKPIAKSVLVYLPTRDFKFKSVTILYNAKTYRHSDPLLERNYFISVRIKQNHYKQKIMFVMSVSNMLNVLRLNKREN